MRAKKSLGQNFLQDPSVIAKIIDALSLHEDDTVIEIGPGRGALTERLIERAGKVIAIEFDRDMIAFLHDRFRGTDNLKVIEDDVLSVDLKALVEDQPAKFVGNLPYNISTPILQRLIDDRASFTTLVLMFQREVADRITAPPGGKERSFLSVLTENAFHTERLFDVPPTAFRPVPKVWSTVVRLMPKASSIDLPAHFREVLSASFAHRRKTLLNNLKNFLPAADTALRSAGIDGTRRAETLTLDEWVRLTDELPKKGRART
jgi:16S rRNA (adenine1518-N6/adenine1519-N6)-dimethyltransferase